MQSYGWGTIACQWAVWAAVSFGIGVQSLPAAQPEGSTIDMVRPAPAPKRLAPWRPLRLQLPTDNHALLEGRMEAFYMGVDRTIDGQSRLVWEGGQYGFVRNPLQSGEETIYTRFHEGVDIAPTQRDARGEPLDLVHAIDEGRVVFVNDKAGASNYGKYVVVEHEWGGGTFYSLYAHLSRVDVKAGAQLKQGEGLGKMGYTGSGLDRRRAHLHLEINVLLSDRFDEWQQRSNPAAASTFAWFHGHNLAGVDVAGLFLALQQEPELSLPEFILRQKPYYQVLAPRGPEVPSLLKRYPWLCPHPLAANTEITAPSWLISFTASGLPVSLEPSSEKAPYPVVTAVIPHRDKHSWRTLNRVSGTGPAAQLTRKGTEYVQLILGTF